MDESTELDRATISRYVEEEARRAVRKGAPYVAALGLVSSPVMWILMRLGVVQGLEVPQIFAAFAGLCTLLVYPATRHGRLSRPVVYALILGFVSLPTLFFLLSHALMPAGAATFLNGPYAFLYLITLILTGLLFDARLVRVASGVAVAGYLLCYTLARPGLAQLSTPDPVMLQDLVAPPLYFFRALMILAGGLLVGSIASFCRRLLLRVLNEEREKQGISRLFGQYVSEEVREKLIREKSGAPGELKAVVVLFSDIRSFTTYSERAEPAALVRHLNEYFDAMVASITAHGGVVDKFIGDAVMGVFGGLLELPDKAGAALEAALEMRRRLRELNAEWASRGVEVLDNGIGLHLGVVLQGSIGSRDRKEFTVIGDAVNTAARLEGMTKDAGYPILVSGALVEALSPERRAACAPLGRTKLKGKQQEVEVFGVAEPEQPEAPLASRSRGQGGR